MTAALTIEGPLDEVVSLREEVVAQFSGQVIVSGLRESDEDILSPGQMGDSPVVSFLIQFASDLSAAGAVATIAAVKAYISKGNRKVEVKESQAASKAPEEHE